MGNKKEAWGLFLGMIFTDVMCQALSAKSCWA